MPTFTKILITHWTLITLLILGGSITVFVLFSSDRSFHSSDQTSLDSLVAGQDSDQDGLFDFYEDLYGTDPNQVDTDQDNTSDLAEILSGRNPNLPATQDQTDQIKPKLASTNFNPDNLTETYLASLSLDTDRSQILDQDRIQVFLTAQDPFTLPVVDSSQFKIDPKAFVSQYQTAYLEAPYDISQFSFAGAFTALLQTDPEPLTNIATESENRLKYLKNLSVPPELISLHTDIIAVHTYLHTNLERLLNLENDLLGALSAADHLKILSGLANDLEQSVRDL